jgi:hypothetical protein
MAYRTQSHFARSAKIAMTTLIGLLAAMFTIAAGGFGVAVLLTRQRLAICEYLALSWLFGTALVSFALWIFGFFVRGLTLQMATTAVCICLGAIGFARQRRLPPAPKEAVNQRWNIIFVVLFAIELLSILWLSFQHTLGWDGLTVWELKARYAFLNNGVLPREYFADASRWFSHPEYPLLLPLTETWFYLWIGDCDQFWIKLVFPIWYAPAMAMLYLAAKELTGSRWISWIIVLLFPLVPAIHSAPGGVAVGYADVPLAAIYLAAIFYLLRFSRDRSTDAMMIFIAISATLPWMKREGAILWCALAIAGALVIWQRRGLKTALLSVAPGILLIVLWTIFLAAVHTLPPRDFVSVGLGMTARVPGIARALFAELTDLPQWDIFWILVGFALAGIAFRQRSARALLLGWLFFAPLIAYCASYIFSAWPDYRVHIDTSLPRLLIQLTSVAWLLIALALRSPSFIPPAPLAPPPGERLAPEKDCS